MNCNNNNMNDDIALTLEKIIEMQRREVREEIREEFCDADFLGERGCRKECNTRPIQVFTDDDKPWECPVRRDEDGCSTEGMEKSCVFRAERVQNGTVTLRALKEKRHEHGHEENERFESTDSFITVKLGCICALRCLKDTFVDLCIR